MRRVTPRAPHSRLFPFRRYLSLRFCLFTEHPSRPVYVHTAPTFCGRSLIGTPVHTDGRWGFANPYGVSRDRTLIGVLTAICRPVIVFAFYPAYALAIYTLSPSSHLTNSRSTPSRAPPSLTRMSAAPELT